MRHPNSIPQTVRRWLTARGNSLDGKIIPLSILNMSTPTVASAEHLMRRGQADSSPRSPSTLFGLLSRAAKPSLGSDRVLSSVPPKHSLNYVHRRRTAVRFRINHAGQKVDDVGRSAPAPQVRNCRCGVRRIDG